MKLQDCVLKGIFEMENLSFLHSIFDFNSCFFFYIPSFYRHLSATFDFLYLTLKINKKKTPDHFCIFPRFFFIHIPAFHWWNLWLIYANILTLPKKKERKRRRSKKTSMLSSQPVHRLSGLCMNSIADTPDAFFNAAILPSVEMRGGCISFCSPMHFLHHLVPSVFHFFLFVCYSSCICKYWTTCCLHHKQQGRNRAGKRVCVFVFCGYRGLFLLDQRLHVAGSRADLFLTFTLSRAK